jgi:holliday junction DNA helicase RuvA
MIATLQGIVIEQNNSGIVLLVGGVGYGVTLSMDDAALTPVGAEALLHIAENIKEDAYDLYGFIAQTKKELYRQLVSVNGVGPKAAMALLSVGSEQEIRQAIASGDTALLSRANGVGKKVAERVVVDLKSKVGLLEGAQATAFLHSDPNADSDEAVQGLVALGYSLADAKSALATIDTSLSTELRIRHVLRGK